MSRRSSSGDDGGAPGVVGEEGGWSDREASGGMPSPPISTSSGGTGAGGDGGGPAVVELDDKVRAVQSMGFSRAQAEEGLRRGTDGTVTGAIEWILQHGDKDLSESLSESGVGFSGSIQGGGHCVDGEDAPALVDPRDDDGNGNEAGKEDWVGFADFGNNFGSNKDDSVAAAQQQQQQQQDGARLQAQTSSDQWSENNDASAKTKTSSGIVAPQDKKSVHTSILLTSNDGPEFEEGFRSRATEPGAHSSASIDDDPDFSSLARRKQREFEKTDKQDLAIKGGKASTEELRFARAADAATAAKATPGSSSEVGAHSVGGARAVAHQYPAADDPDFSSLYQKQQRGGNVVDSSSYSKGGASRSAGAGAGGGEPQQVQALPPIAPDDPNFSTLHRKMQRQQQPGLESIPAQERLPPMAGATSVYYHQNSDLSHPNRSELETIPANERVPANSIHLSDHSDEKKGSLPPSKQKAMMNKEGRVEVADQGRGPSHEEYEGGRMSLPRYGGRTSDPNVMQVDSGVSVGPTASATDEPSTMMSGAYTDPRSNPAADDMIPASARPMAGTIDPFHDEDANGGGGEGVVATAYTVDENIVEAENVLPEDELGKKLKPEPMSRKKKACIAAGFVCLVAGIVLATLGATGQFGDQGPDASALGEEFTPTPAPTVDIRSCDDLESNCWFQRGPELRGDVPGDEFAFMVSLADGFVSGLDASTRRIAVSAPESGAGGIDSGLVRVYDIGNFDAIGNEDDVDSGGNGTTTAAAAGPARASWMQVGQDIVGSPGDEILGYLSSDGKRLAVGGWLSNGPDGRVGFVGQVRVFELPANGTNWTLIGEPVYGEFANGRFGRWISLNRDGTIFAASSQLNTGEVRVYEEVNGTWVQRGDTLQGNAIDSEFGRALSMSHDGDVLAVGAQDHPNDEGVVSGIARVLKWNSTTQRWTRMGKSDLQGEADGDLFGHEVKLTPDGMTVAVSAKRSEGINGTNAVGKVFVFTYDEDADEWNTIGTPVYGAERGDALESIALSHDADFLAVGSENRNNDTGYVRVYHIMNGDWTQLGGELTGRTERESFGSTVSLDGTGSVLVVGASPDNKLRLDGLVRVFELPSLQDVSDILGEEPGDRIGNHLYLALNGSRVCISTPHNTVNGEEAGVVRVFDVDDSDGSLTQVGQDLYGDEEDEAAGYLTREGTRLAVAGRWNDGINGTQKDIGKVAVYQLTPSSAADGNSGGNNNWTWTPLGDPIYGENVKDRAGKEAAINDDGTVLAIAAPKAGGTGQVRVFRYSEETAGLWKQVGPTLAGMPGDDFGWHVALSSDGTICAVGARHNDGGGDRSGQVRVFRLDASTDSYVQMGDDVYGEPGGEAGKGISLSADGRTLASSTPGSDDNGEDSGSARVFDYDEHSDKWVQRGGNLTGAIAHDGLIRVALAPNGNRLVTAAHRAGGDERGFVDVYDFIEGEWRRVGGRIWGKGPGEGFGWAIAISSDGTRLAVGGPARNAQDPMYGVVRLYRLPPIYDG